LARQIVQYDLAQAEARCLIELSSRRRTSKTRSTAQKHPLLAKLAAIGLTEYEIKALIG
jgi:hypothetical protein